MERTPDTPPLFPRAIFAATGSGALALDSDSKGGNPFATALIDALDKEIEQAVDLFDHLKILTEKQSHNRQSPDLLQTVQSPVVPFSPLFRDAPKLALVAVYSDYMDSEASSLPGAEFDLKRIRKALQGKGFDCWGLLDPSQSQWDATLDVFRKASEQCEFSVLYVTGHGVEVEDTIYLIPPGYKLANGKAKLAEEAIPVMDLARFQAAAKGNLLFYGGCRNDPF